ncbi:hypothetical protein TNCV_3584601 [Trichonephila clavipes]|nr:hypothetical protein TNCV_3584601 [Trichonephila clavipes]
MECGISHQRRDPDDPDQDNGTKLLNYCMSPVLDKVVYWLWFMSSGEESGQYPVNVTSDPFKLSHWTCVTDL